MTLGAAPARVRIGRFGPFAEMGADGETVTASILLRATGDRSIAVPSAAVQMIGDKPFVFVRTANGFKATPVTLGRTNGGNVTVASGLTGDERIASTNSFTLKAELGKGEAKDED